MPPPPPGFDLGLTIKATCVKCGTERDIPERDDTVGFPATDDSGVTVGTPDRCRCGATRVRIGAEIDDGHKPSPKPGR